MTHATVLARQGLRRSRGARPRTALVTDATVLAIAEHCSTTFLVLTGCDEITDKCCVEGSLVAVEHGDNDPHCSNFTDKAVVALAKGCALLQKLKFRTFLV